MTQQLITTQTRAGTFDTVAQADRAIRNLLAAGFSKEQLAVICPAKFKDHFLPDAPQAAAPTADAAGTLAVGGAMGATLGGLALAATVITGGVGGAVAAAAYIGGGAFAGAFSNLIVSKGYEQESDDHYRASDRARPDRGGRRSPRREPHASTRGSAAHPGRSGSCAGLTRSILRQPRFRRPHEFPFNQRRNSMARN